MYRTILCTKAAILLYTSMGMAQDYAVDQIDDALLKDANVVKRTEQVRFDVLSPTNTIMHRKYALTILNEQGADESEFAVFYSKLSSVKSFNGTLYDAAGKEIKKIKLKELKDESAVSSGSLMDDYRVKRYELYHRTYPYTIVYEYEEQNNNSLFFENWQPVEGEKYAVEQSQFAISYPKGTKVRYRSFNYEGEPRVTEEKDREVLSWEIRNYKSIKWEPYSKPISQLTPVVLTGPEEFQIEGYKGNMASWENFGKFVHSLLENRQALPEKVKSDVKQLTQGLKSDEEKVRVLYEYMQKNTRYISIQLGLGGWQPFDANYVATNAYGDCKALTNYMGSLLKEVGIKSHYTLIRAGDRSREIVSDMPSQQFNHVILAVPLQQDTVWLECTSQTLPTGYLSAFTANRFALLVDESGGKLVRTPKYGMDINTQIRKIRAKVDVNGGLTSEVETVYRGLQQDDVHDMIHHLTKDKQKEYLNRSLPLSTYEVSTFSYAQEAKGIPLIREVLNVRANNYAQTTSKRLMIEPNVLSKRQGRLPNESRNYSIMLNYSYHDIDTVFIDLPTGYQLEIKPENMVLKSRFGEYENSVELRADQLVYYRSYKQYDGEYPPTDYKELTAFYDAIHRADRKQVVLLKKE